MLLSIIHNLYRRNPFVNETVRLNLLALEESGVDYQYLIFNDKGDKDIKQDVKEFLINKNVKYIYSKTNFGQKICSGGWIGALPHVKGELIHNFGQDDVFTSIFYKMSIDIFEKNPDFYLTFTNCFVVNEKLEILSYGMNPEFLYDFSKPTECFKLWFGIDEQLNQVTRANNNIMAPGAIYRKSLHDSIGLPNLEDFGGTADFEYWARILFYEYKCHYISAPLWLYRKSEYSAGNEIIDGIINRGTAENPGLQQMGIEKIKQKYFDLWEKRTLSKK